MLALGLPDPSAAALIVDALLLAAEVERLRDPVMCARYETLADEIGDALDESPHVPAYPLAQPTLTLVGATG